MIIIEENFRLQSYNTFGLKANARIFAEWYNYGWEMHPAQHD